MNEFKDQLDAAEKEKVSGLLKELKELTEQAQTGEDSNITGDAIRSKVSEVQNASLGLFQKVSCLSPVKSRLALTLFQVYEKRAAESAAPEEPAPEQPPKEEKKD